mgnify:CR=1 FL=1
MNRSRTCKNGLKQFPKSGTPILHWFLGTKKQVLDAVDLGCYFSVGPAMLESARGKKVISWLPQERILLETNGPFAKVEGQALFPSDVGVVIDHLCILWNLDLENTSARVRQNLVTLIV